MDMPDSARAWLMAAAAFVVGFVVFGTLYSFGVVFAPMETEFHAARATTSALFSITGFAFYMLGPLAGNLGDRLGPGVMAGLGAVIMGGSLALTGFISHLWIGYITYGIGVGVGAACAYVPTLAIIGSWFVRHRSTALGISAAGTGCGTLLMPPLTASLIARGGWRVTDMVIGAASALLLAGCAAVVRPPPNVPAAAALHSLRRVVCSYSFIMLYVSWVLATTALFVPFVYLPAFATRAGASEMAASALLSLIGGMSILGRAGLGTLCDRIGIARLFRISVLLMALSYLLWLTLPSYGWLVVFAAVLGLGYGVRIALMPGVLIECFGLQNLGTILGVFFTASGVAAVLGPLLAGWIVDHSGSYEWAIGFALLMGSLGFLAILPLRIGALPRDNPVDGRIR
jgi:MFS family permease